MVLVKSRSAATQTVFSHQLFEYGTHPRCRGRLENLAVAACKSLGLTMA